MKRIIALGILSVLVMIVFSACGNASTTNSNTAKQNYDSSSDGIKDTNQGELDNIPNELEQIPEGYNSPAKNSGTLEELYYDTYESRTYEQKTKQIQKRAIVYLPYGYSEKEKYNVFYLMHGGWSDETSLLGTPAQPSMFKNIIDNAIENGDFEPLIIVCPTYNNESENDSADYSLAFNTLTVNYHNELVNDLIPAVEGQYSTYAESTSPEDFFIYAMTGTDDFECGHFTRQIEGMLSMPSGNFVEADNEADGNLAFRVKEGYAHDGEAAMEYTYNGLRWFWNEKTAQTNTTTNEAYTVDTKIAEVINDPVFGEYGRLIFPVDDGYYSGETLGELQLTWYSNIDPAKEDTGLFFFKGNPGEKFAVCNAGGGFAYVGAMHDSFPHALELSKRGYNAFALIYRPDAQKACEDLARAISFIFEHAEELEVNTECYSLWGGSAGGRMAAYLGTYGTLEFGGADLPRPGAVIMQYTGHRNYSKDDPPTYACVGENDGIASYLTMERRLAAMAAVGIDTEFHKYPGLSHGFGLGTGTVAEGWIDDAVSFWERQNHQEGIDNE